MCWWIFGHCWHGVDASARKIPANKNKCKYSNPYIGISGLGKYFVVRIAQECCHCKKRKFVIYKNYNMSEYNTYNVYGTDTDNSGIYWG